MAAVAQMDRYDFLPDAAHDSRNQGRVVSLSVLSLLPACLRLCQLREVHHSLRQNPWSRTQSAARDEPPACCTSSLMLRVCASCSGYYPLNHSCVHCLCCCCANSGACPVWPVLFGALYRPLQRRSASDKCWVRCRPIKQRQNLPQLLIKTYLR